MCVIIFQKEFEGWTFKSRNPNAIDPTKLKPSEFYQQQSSSSGSTSAETSSVLVAATPSSVVSSLDTTPCSSSSSIIPESSISNSSQLSEETAPVPCFSTQSPPSTPVSSASNSGRGTPITNPLVAAGLVPSYHTALFLLQSGHLTCERAHAIIEL